MNVLLVGLQKNKKMHTNKIHTCTNKGKFNKRVFTKQQKKYDPEKSAYNILQYCLILLAFNVMCVSTFLSSNVYVCWFLLVVKFRKFAFVTRLNCFIFPVHVSWPLQTIQLAPNIMAERNHNCDVMK